MRQLHSAGQPKGKVLLQFWGTALGGLHGALIDQLDRQGAQVFVDADVGYQFGYGRVATPGEVSSVWYVTEESEAFSLLSADAGAKVLAVSDPLPPQQGVELVAMQRQVAAELTADGKANLVGDLGNEFVGFLIPKLPNVSPTELNTVAVLDKEVNRGTCLCGVVAFPSHHVPPQLRGDGTP
jgi:hypothetical protein